jgi:hypothetical protein
MFVSLRCHFPLAIVQDAPSFGPDQLELVVTELVRI